MNNNLIAIDATLAQFNAGINLQGLWLNSQIYTAGMSVIDGLTGQVWANGITHTSIASPGTFLQDRTANPTYWSNITNPASTAAVSAAAAAGSAAAALVSQTAASGSAVAAAASAVTAASVASALATTLRGYIGGLTLSNDSGTPLTKLDVAAGNCSDSTNTVNIVLGAFVKSTAGAWVAGTGNNGMGVALTIANNTWYHVFAVVVAGVADVYFDTSVTAVNKPASTTAFRRIGSFLTNGAAAIVAFVQSGDKFDWTTPVQDLAGTPAVTTGGLFVLTVPLGVSIEAIVTGNMSDASTPGILYLSSPTQADVAASASAFTCQTATGSLGTYRSHIITNTASQIRRRVNSTTSAILVSTQGWYDTRGRFA